MSRVRRPLGELATAGERRDRSGTTTPTNAARTTAAQAGLRRITDAQFFVTQCKRAMILLIAFTGLIGAACVNGTPSITCYALADAYTISLANLGALFLIEFFVIVVIIGVEKQLKDANVYTIKNFSFGLGISVAFVLVFVFLQLCRRLYTVLETFK